MVEDGVAALAQGRLRAEVGDDVHQAVAQPRNLQPRRNLLHQPQRIHVAAYVVQQSTCAPHLKLVSVAYFSWEMIHSNCL